MIRARSYKGNYPEAKVDGGRGGAPGTGGRFNARAGQRGEDGVNGYSDFQ